MADALKQFVKNLTQPIVLENKQFMNEMQAVESEYQLSLQDDQIRAY